jgi:hypothetical protein
LSIRSALPELLGLFPTDLEEQLSMLAPVVVSLGHGTPLTVILRLEKIGHLQPDGGKDRGEFASRMTLDEHSAFTAFGHA